MQGCRTNQRICKSESSRALVVAMVFSIVLGITPAHFASARQNGQLTDEQAVAAGAEALRSAARFPWYDAERDDLRDVEAARRASDDSDTREKGWQKAAKPTRNPDVPAPPVAGRGNWWGSWGTGWGAWTTSLMQVLAIVLLVVLVAALAYLLIRYFLAEEQEALGPARSDKPTVARDSAADAVRMENLPFEMQVRSDDPLVNARRGYEAGRYGEAIIYLYAYQLLELDRHQFIHLARGKTNRQYLREIRARNGLRELAGDTVVVFEDVFFGQHPLPRERFETVWNRLDEFHRLLEQGAIL